MAVEFAAREISQKYDCFARWYDWVEGVPDLLGVREASPQLAGVCVGRRAGSCRRHREKFSLLSSWLPDYGHGCQQRDVESRAKTRSKTIDGYTFSLVERKLSPLQTTASIQLFPRLALAHFHIRPMPFERWRAFVERTARSYYWSTAEAIVTGLDVARIGMQINLPIRLAVTGIANHLSSLHRRT